MGRKSPLTYLPEIADFPGGEFYYQMVDTISTYGYAKSASWIQSRINSLGENDRLDFLMYISSICEEVPSVPIKTLMQSPIAKWEIFSTILQDAFNRVCRQLSDVDCGYKATFSNSGCVMERLYFQMGEDEKVTVFTYTVNLWESSQGKLFVETRPYCTGGNDGGALIFTDCSLEIFKTEIDVDAFCKRIYRSLNIHVPTAGCKCICCLPQPHQY